MFSTFFSGQHFGTHCLHQTRPYQFSAYLVASKHSAASGWEYRRAFRQGAWQVALPLLQAMDITWNCLSHEPNLFFFLVANASKGWRSPVVHFGEGTVSGSRVRAHLTCSWQQLVVAPPLFLGLGTSPSPFLGGAVRAPPPVPVQPVWDLLLLVEWPGWREQLQGQSQWARFPARNWHQN